MNESNNRGSNVCLSGGAEGADAVFGEIATAAGHEVVHFAFHGMHSATTATGQQSFHVLSPEELQAADPFVLRASTMIKRHPPRKGYVKKLIRRNYYQVQTAERVYAVTRWNLVPESKTKETMEGQLGGGTGWAVAMAIQLGVASIYLYALERELWYVYNHQDSKWQRMGQDTPPAPSGRYAGIGSRDLGERGVAVIQELFEGTSPNEDLPPKS